MARMDRLHQNALVAAISAVTPSEVANLTTTSSAGRYWRYYRKLPDIRYVVNLEGRLLAMSEPQLERMDDNGMWQFVDDPPPEALGALTTVYDSPGGVEDVCRRFAQQYAMDGELYLVGYNKSGTTVIESMSTSELYGENKTWYRRDSINSQGTALPMGTKVSRVWRRHPEISRLAETPMEALVDDMETLLFLNDALRARVRSRLAAAGILFLPNSITSATPSELPDGTGQPIDSVTRQLLEAMAAAIRDPDSPDAAMPVIVRGPDGVGELIKHITLDRLIDEQEMKLRKELRANILNGLDAPTEIASSETKMIPTNHWNDSSVKMEMWEHTVAPIGDALWESLTQMILTPWLRKKNVEGRYRWRVNRDSVQIRNNQDEKTRVALDRHLIGDAAARRRLGIPDTDSPSEEEYVRAVGVKMAIPELAFYKMDLGIDLSTIGSVNTGPPKTGDGRILPADTPTDRPQPGDPRVR